MIQIRINSESQLYNSFDPSRTRISGDVYDYLKTFCTDINWKTHLHDKLQVIADGPVDAERLRQALSAAVRRDQGEFDHQIRLAHKRAVGGYVIGIGLSILGVTLSVLLDQVLLAIISFLGTTVLREAFMLHARVIPDIKRLKRRLSPFADMEVEVVRAGGNSVDDSAPDR